MKMKMAQIGGAVLALGFSAVLYAGNCEMSVTRTACPGMEAVSYKKCDGKAFCVEAEAAADATACQAATVKACSNKRYQITKSKVITAKFDGKAIKSASGKDDFCADYPQRAAEFDQCDK